MTGDLSAKVEAEVDIDVGDGLQLHVVRSGSGPAVLMLHGFTGSAATWLPLRAALGDRFATIAVDLPGHGASSVPTGAARYALGRLADDLVRVLDRLGVARAVVLGYSMGGRAALRFALEHPDRVSALMLESSSPGIADVTARERRCSADAALADEIEGDGVASFVQRWERLPLWASQHALPAAMRNRLRAQRLANTAGGLANSLRGAGAGAEADVTGRLATLDAPTLLIAGALDAKYVTLGRSMAQVMRRARLTIVDGAGHAVHLERPEEFAILVADFLDAVR